MHKPKYPKKNLRNPKHINPDSDQRKSSEGEKEHLNNVAWVARSLGLRAAWAAQAGSRGLGLTRWSSTWVAHSGLKPI